MKGFRFHRYLQHLSEIPMTRFAPLMVGLLSIAACTSSRDTALQEIPSGFRVAIAEGGGFTGLWQGYTVHADGSVDEWSGSTGQTSTRQQTPLSPQTLRELWTTFYADSTLQHQSIAEAGDLTRTLEVTAGQDTFRYSWVPRPSAQGLAGALQAYYHLVLQQVTAERKE